jgi:oxalate decarboxylase/phosphoglucose isomerase-like protein (cupin superfamily)
VDPLTFPTAALFSAAIVTVKPGAIREIHWHPSSDEWTFFIEGQGRATLFTPPASANTFDFRAGDVGYFPKSNSHYLENTGTTDLVFVEVLQADHFSGMSPFSPSCFPFSFSGFLVNPIRVQIFPLASGSAPLPSRSLPTR